MRKSMSKSAVRAVALVIATSMIGSAGVQAAEVTKDESVYVILDSTGKVKKTTVSNWLHSDEKDIKVEDKSNLDNIKNVKGDNEPRVSGEKLTWNMEDTDLYYRGTSTSKLPFDVEVKYFLDDKEYNPEDMAGKSGKMRIELEVKNTEFKDAEINGKVKRIYSPLTVAAVVTLPLDKFTGITTEGGKLLSEGNNTIVGFASVPGLKESLDLGSIPLDIDINDKLKEKLIVEADVENFSLGPIMITATPNLPADIEGLDSADKLSDVRDKLSQLQDGIDQMASGSKQLNTELKNANKNDIQPLFNMFNTNEMQEKLSLVTNQNKVNLSRKLIDDAYFAKDINTSGINNLMEKFNSGALINGVKDNIKSTLKASVIEGLNNPVLDVYAKNILKSQVNGEMGNKIKGTIKYGVKNGVENGIDDFLNSNRSDFNKKINEGNLAVDSALNLYNQASPLLQLVNDPVMNSLVKEIASLKQNYSSLSGESKEVVDAFLSLANPEVIMSAKKAIDEGKSLANDFSEVHYIVQQAIMSMPGDNGAEKTNNFIRTLNGTLVSLQELGKVDFDSMSKDIKEYSSAYLVVKAQLGAALKQEQAVPGTLEETKNNLINMVRLAYGAENSKELEQFISSFDASKITDKNDISKLKYYEKLLENIKESTGNIKSLSPILKAVTDVLGKENEGNKIISTLNDLDNMSKVLNPVLAKAGALSDQDKMSLLNLVDSVKKFKGDLEANSAQIDKALAIVSSLNVNDMVNKLTALKGTLDQTKQLILQAQGLINEVNGKSLLEKADFDKKFDNTMKSFDTNSIIDGIKVSDMLKNLDVDSMMNELNVNGKIDSASSALMGQYSSVLKDAKDLTPKLMDMQKDLQQSEDILRILNECLAQNEVDRARNLMNSLPDKKEKLNELTAGVQTLEDGITKYKAEGIDILTSKGTEALDKVDELKATKDELVNMSKGYGSFSGTGDEMKCTTKFVVKTAEIEEVDNEEEAKVEAKEEKKGFWAWLKSLFGLE